MSRSLSLKEATVETEQGLVKPTILQQQGGASNVATAVRIVNKILVHYRDISRASLVNVSIDSPRRKYNKGLVADDLCSTVPSFYSLLTTLGGHGGGRDFCYLRRSRTTVSG